MHILLAAVLWLIAMPSAALDEATLRTQQMQRLEEPAPDFVLHDGSGTGLRLAALHGRPVIVHVRAAWCRPCRKELPMIQPP